MNWLIVILILIVAFVLDRAEHLGTAPKATPKRIPKATKDIDSPELMNEWLREAREYMTDPRVSEADKIAFRVRAEMAREDI